MTNSSETGALQALVLCDDPWHPAQRIRDGLAPLGAAGFHWQWIENPADWSPELMAEFPVVVLSKSNNRTQADATPWMTPEVEAAFAAYVERGGGLVAIHSGTAGYVETPTLRALLGGVFLEHPAQCTVAVEPAAGHPLAQGSSPFTAHDEHYFMALDDGAADVFVWTSSEHGRQPGGWTHRHGTGRVCVLTPGHNLPVWLEPAYTTLIRNAIAWCARQD
jgi:uncharacterized protein